MFQDDITYISGAGDRTETKQEVSVFANGASVRADIVTDCEGAGLLVCSAGNLDQFTLRCEMGSALLSDVVIIDCPEVDPQMMAHFLRLDMDAARAGKRIVVMTSLDCLDDVFGCFDQSKADILIGRSRTDLLLLLARMQARGAGAKVCEMSAVDRTTLLRLSEQVSQMAQDVARLSVLDMPPLPTAFDFAPDGGLGKDASTGTDALVQSSPDAQAVRAVIRNRQRRAKFFDGELFADPAWDMLLDLTAARAEGVQVSVSSLCIAASVPATTALRWIAQLVDAGLFEKAKDVRDGRRAFISLSEEAARAMSGYFAETDVPQARAA